MDNTALANVLAKMIANNKGKLLRIKMPGSEKLDTPENILKMLGHPSKIIIETDKEEITITEL